MGRFREKGMGDLTVRLITEITKNIFLEKGEGATVEYPPFYNEKRVARFLPLAVELFCCILFDSSFFEPSKP